MPDGTRATIGADFDLDFPNGTVLVKSFERDGHLIETRLFMRHDDGVWAGYTYEWDDDGEDATLVTVAKKRSFEGGGEWLYPSGAQCMQCHTQAAGFTLGLELAQLTRQAEYPETRRRAPQVETLVHIGVIDTPTATPPAGPLPVPYGEDITAALDDRARSYLHVNCAFCHQPGGTGGGNLDLRYARTFAETRLCNGMPAAGDLGVAGASILVPGQPERSVLSLRLHAADDKRMPPLASLLPDTEAIETVDAWIRSLTTCP